MGSLSTKGIKYFSFDVGFFADKKVRLLRSEHNSEGIEVFQRLLCKIYSENGYYLPWDGEVDCALMADETGYTIGKIQQIVSTCLKWSLFDYTLFKVGNVLSSLSIQRRYFSAIKEARIKAAPRFEGQPGRYTVIEKGLCLLKEDDISEFNKARTWLKVAQNQEDSTNYDDNSTKSEVDSTKNALKKSKVNKSTTTTAREPENQNPVVVVKPFETMNLSRPDEAVVIKHFQNNINFMPGSIVIGELCSWLDTFPAEVIVEAINEAVRAEKRSMRYISGTLRNWSRDGLLTLSLVEGHLNKWHNRSLKSERADSTSGEYLEL